MEKYNTQNPPVLLKEYGRNIQKIVEYIVKLEDREQRTQYAHNLIELMRQINPNTRDSQDYQNKLWDDLYIMSRFNLDVESPFPMPDKAMLGKKPKRLDYNVNNIRYKHYGRNVELLIDKARSLEDPEDKKYALAQVGKLMKSFYVIWNKDNVQDITIIEHIEKISGKKLDQEIKDYLTNDGVLDVIQPREKKSSNKKSKKKKK